MLSGAPTPKDERKQSPALSGMESLKIPNCSSAEMKDSPSSTIPHSEVIREGGASMEEAHPMNKGEKAMRTMKAAIAELRILIYPFVLKLNVEFGTL